MGIFDSFKNRASDLMEKAEDLAKEHQPGAEDKMGEGMDRAGDMADDATGNRFSDQIDRGVDVAKQRLATDPDQA
jgi:hypothetical protein